MGELPKKNEYYLMKIADKHIVISCFKQDIIKDVTFRVTETYEKLQVTESSLKK